jgi:phosphatidylinositol alpha-mannosyltransferase
VHVVCCPNTGNESQGYVLLEALAARVPVVASNIEGFAGVVTHEAEAILVKPRDHEAIAAALLRLLRDPALRKGLAGRGQALAAHYSWDNIAHRVLSYYERLLYEQKQVAEVRERRAFATAADA